MKIFYPVKPILACITLLLTVLNTHSQDNCGFDRHHREKLKNNSTYKKGFAEIELKVKALLADKEFMKVQAPVYTIPVVVHVIHKGEAVGVGNNISDAQIQSAINSLTQYYRGTLGTSVDAEIQFQLASLDPNCNPTNGIVRIDGRSVTNYNDYGLTLSSPSNELAVKGLSIWPNHYYNIWVVSEIEGNDGGGGIQGFANFPGAPSNQDGTVVLASSFGYDPGGSLGYALKGYTNLNTTLAHEIGHAFGLYHTFEGDDTNYDNVVDGCPANASCSTDGDEVCDTDPHVRSNSNCPSGLNACNGNTPESNIVHNFMDYSSEACKTNFTSGQITRMRAYLTGARPSLINSLGLSTSSPISPYVPPVAAAFTPATITPGPGSYAGIYNLTINDRARTSSTAQNDNGYINGVNSCLNLIQLFRGVTYTLSATIMAYNHEQFGAWIDYNNDGDFLDTLEQLALNTHIPGTGVSGQNLTLSLNFTVPNTAPLNTAVRLRIMDDISTNYGGIPDIASNTNSQYGQAEDYPLYFSSILPVVMHSFTGELADNHAKLQWSATIDQQASGFDIERSYNGIDFKKIGYVSVTQGEGSRPAKFSFSDPDAARENNYYRLKQWDIDKSFEFSNTVFIKSSRTSGAGFSVLNNPFNNYIDVVFAKSLKGQAAIRLLDINGKEVYSTSISGTAGQKYRIDLSGKTLLKGIYILEIRSNDGQQSEKLIRY